MFARLLLVLLLCGSAVVPAESLLRAQDKPGAKNPWSPADPIREAKRAKKLADDRLPSLQELRQNNDWKPSWEIPEAIALRYGPPETEEQYWQGLGRRPFVGLTAEEAKSRIPVLEDSIKKRDEKYLGPLSKRDLCLSLLNSHRIFHPTSPTNAVVTEEDLAVSKLDSELAVLGFKNDQERSQWIQMKKRRVLDLRASFYSGLNDEQLAERVVQTFALIQKSTSLRYFRTNKWDELTMLSAALRKRQDLLMEFGRKLRTTTNEDQQNKLRKDFEIPLKKSDEPFLDENGQEMGLYELLAKRQIRWSTVTVTVRQVALDALNLLPDLTDASAALLEVKLNALYKDAIKARTAKEEKILENMRKSIEHTSQGQEELDQYEKRWRVIQAATYKVRMLDKGHNSYVISTRLVDPLGFTEFTWHWASIRNGIVVADISMKSNLPEAETNRDLEFFVNVMHEKTLYGRIEDEAPKTPGSGK